MRCPLKIHATTKQNGIERVCHNFLLLTPLKLSEAGHHLDYSNPPGN